MALQTTNWGCLGYRVREIITRRSFYWLLGCKILETMLSQCYFTGLSYFLLEFESLNHLVCIFVLLIVLDEVGIIKFQFSDSLVQDCYMKVCASLVQDCDFLFFSLISEGKKDCYIVGLLNIFSLEFCRL